MSLGPSVTVGPLCCPQAERRAYREAEMNMMDDLSEGDCQKQEEPASPDPAPSQPQTDPASPTVAVTPEPVARGDQATPREMEYQVQQTVNGCDRNQWDLFSY